MKFIFNIILIVFVLTASISCETKKEPVKKTKISIEKKIDKGTAIINQAIKAHGGELYSEASYKFTFRNKEYTFTNTNNSYRYSVKTTTGNQETLDILDNSNFSRMVNGEKIVLNDQDISRYSESLNSVIYFATLPYKLKDNSVNKKFIGTKNIKGNNYNVVKITFNQEGGGKDFDDQYYYWINTSTNIIDFFAYNYTVNNGGVRFRSSYNRRNVGGIIFQDYINYKAPVGTPLGDLPALFEKGELEEVSRIDTENVVNLKN